MAVLGSVCKPFRSRLLSKLQIVSLISVDLPRILTPTKLYRFYILRTKEELTFRAKQRLKTNVFRAMLSHAAGATTKVNVTAYINFILYRGVDIHIFTVHYQG